MFSHLSRSLSLSLLVFPSNGRATQLLIGHEGVTYLVVLLLYDTKYLNSSATENPVQLTRPLGFGRVHEWFPRLFHALIGFKSDVSHLPLDVLASWLL